MATQPPPRDPSDPIDPTIPDELPPVITPDRQPAGPDGIPEVGPDLDVPDSAPDEMPEA